MRSTLLGFQTLELNRRLLVQQRANHRSRSTSSGADQTLDK